jgi:hypothetical protein
MRGSPSLLINKEHYYYCQKRPTILSKETYYTVKRDLLYCRMYVCKHVCTHLLGQLAEVSEGSDGLERRLAAGTFGCNSCHLLNSPT